MTLFPGRAGIRADKCLNPHVKKSLGSDMESKQGMANRVTTNKCQHSIQFSNTLRACVKEPVAQVTK
jgi:hypothetical protein